jgi:GNAT superfamily N-acetyltransferase
MASPVVIRQERAEDAAGIRRVNELAFAQPAEADLVDALRDAGARPLSLAAEREGRIVGHILFSPVTIESPGEAFPAVGLGPMAVEPGLQQGGIGSALVRAGLSHRVVCTPTDSVACYPRLPRARVGGPSCMAVTRQYLVSTYSPVRPEQFHPSGFLWGFRCESRDLRRNFFPQSPHSKT